MFTVRIGYRTMKTAIAAPFALWIAELLQLDNYASAGIIAVLCIQPTRKKSLLTAWHRLGAGLVSIGFIFVIFEFIGYHPLSVGILLLTFIPVTIYLKLVPGIVTSLVILFHFYTAGEVTWTLIGNEIAIMTIGIGSALMLNVYMPSLDSKLQNIQKDVEVNYQQIFKALASYLHKEKESLPNEEMSETAKLFKQAEILVMRDVENHFYRDEHAYKDYFIMRTRQFDLLERMMPLISPLKEVTEQSHRIADLFEDLADSIYPDNPVQNHLDTVERLKVQFEQDDLPQTRQEFEIRANLFRLIYEIEQYLIIKHKSMSTQLGMIRTKS